MTYLKELKEKYAAGQIGKPDYIDRMHLLHQYLFQYTEFIRDTDISRIEISDGAVAMTSRSAGTSFYCDPQDKRVVPVEILNFGSYEKTDFDMILKLIGEGSVVFDIGANIGWHSVNISKLVPDAEIYAFEPVPRTFSFLERNIALNNASAVRAFNFGFSTGEETVAFYYDPACSGNASSADLSQSGGAGRIDCRVRRMDDFVKENRLQVDFIKCDVEGGELLVFQGGLETIARSKPIIFAEMLRKWSAAFGYHPNDVIRLLGGFGYRCFVARDGRLAGFHWMDENTADTNFYFLHTEKHSELLSRVSGEPGRETNQGEPGDASPAR
jgi:FkbM family methyltransferase